jgi:hypothetical protein
MDYKELTVYAPASGVRERKLAPLLPRRQARRLVLPHEERELAFAHSRRCAFGPASWRRSERSPCEWIAP